MQKEDFSILKQVVLFALLALVLGFAYGQFLKFVFGVYVESRCGLGRADFFCS